MVSPSRRPLALVTGASSGIGHAVARDLATRGFDLVVVAEDTDRLEAAAAELRTLGVEVDAVRADLATEDGVEQAWAAVSERTVSAAVLNAGIGSGGRFSETDLAHELRLVDLNVRSTVHLAKHVVRQMAQRGSGRLLFTSSVAATQPDPFEAVYGASKTFVQSFAEALRTELRGTGVTVTSVLPGPTETRFFARAGMGDTAIGQTAHKDDAAHVARLACDAFLAGREKVVPGGSNKVLTVLASVLPDRAKAGLHARLAAPGSGSR
ncbi:SDR family NAD(P)-dependent oxidoreductase [Nocardioides aurantiacus]|uniref:SDR family NAD(P)-dependent oxidoreductase n=1 Tax=Nocardioides aurantiacus TaxID=86796 RepID=UPI00403F6AF1